MPSPEIQTLYPKVKKPPPVKPRPVEIQAGLAPKAPPVPILQEHGFQGSINDFTAKLNEAVTAHEQVFGYKPSPGLAFDLARFNSPIDYEKLFGVPTTQKNAVALQAVKDNEQAQVPAFSKEVAQYPPEPFIQGETNLTTIEQKQAFAYWKGAATAEQRTKKYPTVPLTPTGQGIILPIQQAGAVETFFSLAKELGGAGTLPVREQGQTLEEYAKMLKASGLSQVDHVIATKSGERTILTDQGQKIVDLANSITKLKDAQKELNAQMGTDLPVTGVFNQTWLQAVSNWMGSENYFQAVVKKQASDAGFNNPQDYQTAWQNKSKAVHKSGWTQHFYNVMPLQLFHHGTDPLNMLRSSAEYLTFDYKTLNPYGPITSGDWSFYSLTKRLHQLTRSGGLALDIIGGTVVQTKADVQAANAFLTTMLIAPYAKKGPLKLGPGESTFEKAKAQMRRNLEANPSWVRVFFPTTTGKFGESEWAKVLNVAGDLILLRKPAYTGEFVPAGSIEAAKGSTYLNYAGHWAYQDLANGDIYSASKMLEHGQGTEQLVARSAPLIKSGKMTEEQFRHHLADLYAHKQTTLIRTGGKPVTIQGDTLHTLSSKVLPTPGTPGKVWLQSKRGLTRSMDNLDTTLRQSPIGNKAAAFISGLRSEFQHYVQPGAHSLSDIKLPERIHDYALKVTGSAEQANQYASKFIELRAKGNYSGMTKLQDDLHDLYVEKYPASKAAEPSTFEPVLGTEGPSQFHFATGNTRGFDGLWNKFATSTGILNRLFVTVAKGHARVILGFPFTGFSLFYKHMVSDTLRRAVAEEGLVGRPTPEMRQAQAELQTLADSNPSISRMLGAFKVRATLSEQRWLLSPGSAADAAPAFQTGVETGAAHMEAAGAYLRRRIDDDALRAYEQVASGSGLEPLTNLVLNNKTYRGMWKSARSKMPKGERISAEDYARNVFSDMRQVEQGLNQAGLTYDDAVAVLRENRGLDTSLRGAFQEKTANKALGELIKKNAVNFTVHSGRVSALNPFDAMSSWWIQKLMTFNKWNRGQLAERTLHKTYASLREAGVEQVPAAQVAASLAERTVEFHMLDFANRLQVEQDLRWVSYFATKHRLYWKWVLGTMVRHPGYAAAVIDAQKAMGGDGNIDFNFFGHKWAIPAARLMWVPGKEYSEESPLLLALKGGFTGGIAGAANAAVGNYGNVITRNDTAIHYGIKLAKIQTGNAPATYGYAVAGLDERSKAFMYQRINSFQNDYFHEHGHFATESEAVKYALLHSLGNELWRSNLPFPIVPSKGGNEIQALHRQYMAMNDPSRRRKFLSDHPELPLSFGIYQDPNDYIHVRPFWQRYTQALDKRDAERAALYQQVKTDGGYTAQTKLARKKSDAAFQEVFDTLIKEDRNGTDKTRWKEIGGKTYGIWGQQISADPLIDPSGVLNKIAKETGLTQSEILPLPAARIKNIRLELNLLNTPSYVASTYKDDPLQANVRKGELLQQLDVYKSYPKDALGKLERDYQINYVGKFYDEEKRRYTVIANLPKNAKEEAYAKFRAWKDSQDKPVVIDGVKFPSPLQMSWQSLDPVTKKERLAQIAGGSWDHLADYEKKLLGIKVTPGTSENWAGWTDLMAQYRHDAGVNRTRLPKGWGAVVAKYVQKNGGDGFYKDYLFAQQPAFVRLAQLSPIINSPHHSDWVGLFSDAKAHRDDTTPYWRDYVNTWVKPQLAKPENRAWAQEVSLYGPDFLYGLIR